MPRSLNIGIPHPITHGMPAAVPHDVPPSPTPAGPPERVPPRSRGFTIVELLLAVLVVGVLAAIAITGWGNYRHKMNIRIAIQDIAVLGALIQGQCAEDGQCPLTMPAYKPDPWGNPYRYLPLNAGVPGSKGHARKDHSLVPINSDFDLYSMGPDGKSSPPLTAKASRDDIVRASDGAFIGVAADY